VQAMSLIDQIGSSQRLRRQMHETMERSRAEGVEMAFPICQNNEGLEAGEREMTRGDFESTTTVLRCPLTGGEGVGSFHSHLQGPRYASRHDISNIAHSGERIVCTGQGDKVVCIEPKAGTGPEQIRATVDEISYYHTPWSLAPEQRYMDALRKNFAVKEFRP